MLHVYKFPTGAACAEIIIKNMTLAVVQPQQRWWRRCNQESAIHHLIIVFSERKDNYA
jgi:hypothetical protein